MNRTRRWNLLVGVVSLLIMGSLGLATRPLAAQTTTAAQAAYRKGDFQQAITVLNRVIVNHDLLVDTDALVLRGLARYHLSDFHGAQQDFQLVLSRTHGYADAWYGLALVQRAQQQPGLARASVARAIALDGDRQEFRTLSQTLGPA